MLVGWSSYLDDYGGRSDSSRQTSFWVVILFTDGWWTMVAVLGRTDRHNSDYGIAEGQFVAQMIPDDI